MQFSCESCKANLQIADEKVRGKRLIVRCKRCGAKIGISDPALAAPKPSLSKPPPSAPSPAPAPTRPAPDARDTDTESTRAMESDLLERALRASKADDPSVARAQVASPSSPPAALATAVSAQAPEWFAMLHGKQAGPITFPELKSKIDAGDIGPRTYLWKDGMGAWQRAKELAELQALFPSLPEAPPPSPNPPPVSQPPLAEFSAADFTPKAPEAPKAHDAPRAAEAATVTPVSVTPVVKDEEERTSVDPLPLGERVHRQDVAKELFSGAEQTSSQKGDLAGLAGELEKKPARPVTTAAPARMFEGAAPPRSRAPFALIVVAVLAAAAAALYFTVGQSSPAQPAEEAADAGQHAAPAADAATSAAPPEAKPAEPPPKPAVRETGLTADQVRRKLDENKRVLQGCIDEALRRDPNLRVGKIHIATTIAPTGQVTAAKIDKSTVDQSPLGACLRRATRKISFPAFAGDAFDVDIPIVVTAGE